MAARIVECEYRMSCDFFVIPARWHPHLTQLADDKLRSCGFLDP